VFIKLEDAIQIHIHKYETSIYVISDLLHSEPSDTGGCASYTDQLKWCTIYEKF